MVAAYHLAVKRPGLHLVKRPCKEYEVFEVVLGRSRRDHHPIGRVVLVVDEYWGQPQLYLHQQMRKGHNFRSPLVQESACLQICASTLVSGMS